MYSCDGMKKMIFKDYDKNIVLRYCHMFKYLFERKSF